MSAALFGLSQRLEMVLQPIVRLGAGGVAGFEALARVAPAEGEPSPGDLPRHAQDEAFHAALTTLMLERAVAQLQAFGACGGAAAHWRISVNISWRDVLDPALPDRLSALLGAHDVAAARLALELSERASAPDLAEAALRLEALRDAGVAVLLDDFGAGAAGWRWLSLPLSGVKLDAELTGLVASARGSRIVGGVLRLAEDLGLPVVAEGVEDAEAAQRLTGLGCGLAQGFFFAPGLAPTEAARWALRWAQP